MFIGIYTVYICKKKFLKTHGRACSRMMAAAGRVEGAKDPEGRERMEANVGGKKGFCFFWNVLVFKKIIYHKNDKDEQLLIQNDGRDRRMEIYFTYFLLLFKTKFIYNGNKHWERHRKIAPLCRTLLLKKSRNKNYLFIQNNRINTVNF